MLDRLGEIQQSSAESIVGDVGVGIHTAVAFLEHFADVYDVDLPATTVFVVEPVDPGDTFSFDPCPRISAHTFPSAGDELSCRGRCGPRPSRARPRARNVSIHAYATRR